jgi:BlaI family transcriptional regulator, penicillinase repressor
MSPRDVFKRPTEAELAILRVLWQRGPCTVRDVHEELARDTGIGYTTALKLLQIMHEKELVARDESERAHVYRARRSKEQTQGQLVRDLVNRAFDGSASELVVSLLGSKLASGDELTEIRRLLDEVRPQNGAKRP